MPACWSACGIALYELTVDHAHDALDFAAMRFFDRTCADAWDWKKLFPE
jgi:hypothetical protein